jgi:hypothetical protein
MIILLYIVIMRNDNMINKMIGLIGLFVVAGVMTGCGSSQALPPVNAQYINLSQDGSFLNNTSGTILEAATAQLDQYVGDEVIYSKKGEARQVSIAYASLATNILGLTSCEVNGDGDNLQCTITISPTVNPDNYSDPTAKAIIADTLAEVLVHEIGHSFGFGHFTDPDHIMYKYANPDNYETISRFQTFASNLNSFRENGTATGYPTLESSTAGDEVGPNDPNAKIYKWTVE